MEYYFELLGNQTSKYYLRNENETKFQTLK